MHLYSEVKTLALEAWNESSHDIDDAMDYLHESCEGHEVAIYYHKAIAFCTAQDTSDGEDYLEDCGNLVQIGDTFGSIACRVAYATLLVKAETELYYIAQEYEGES